MNHFSFSKVSKVITSAFLCLVLCSVTSCGNRNVTQQSDANQATGANSDQTNTIENSKGENINVPFALIEKVPLYPGCDENASNKEKKSCMSAGIAEFVGANFNLQKVKPFSRIGTNKIFVTFKINTEGKVVDVDARGTSPELEEEAERVISNLPTMEPGEQKGEKVSVLYSLPLVYEVQPEEEKEKK